MLTSQRKQWLLQRIQHEGQLLVKPLSEELGISEDTVRRDLRELAAQGLLQRVHGGALPASPAVANLRVRTSLATNEKASLGQAGAALIQSHQTVILDGGTTSLQVVQHLPLDLAATIITHSPSVAVALAEHTRIEVIMLGGRLFRHSMVNVGANVMESIVQFRADLYFMGVTGIQANIGMSTGDYEEASVKRALHSRAAETIVLASSDKVGAASPFTIAPVQTLSQLITPRAAPDAAIASLKATGLAITLI